MIRLALTGLLVAWVVSLARVVQAQRHPAPLLVTVRPRPAARRDRAA